MAVLTQARLRQLFNYEPLSGSLVWRERPEAEFKTGLAYASFVSRCQRKEAGHLCSDGYRAVVIGRQRYLAHKLIWLLVHGEWPEYPLFEIDHINGDRADNRLVNLRKVSKSGNQRNAGRRKNNTSGVHGVNWKADKRNGKGRWVARIWNGPRHVSLGTFDTLHEAQIARKAAERVLGFTGTDREAKP